MAFKKMKDFNEERFGNMFLLRNDGDSADVIFLYRSFDDVLEADVHYIKSADFNGYVHCCGRGCPVCAKGGIRVQQKIFIPVYNITEGELQFWDRSTRFENQLSSDIFSKYANPCNFVFRITRHGAAGSIDTTYSIMAVGKNTDPSLQYSQILADHNTSLPEHYDTICKDFSIAELNSILAATASYSNSAASTGSIPDYQVTPRAAKPAAAVEIPSPDAFVAESDSFSYPDDVPFPVDSADVIDDNVEF